MDTKADELTITEVGWTARRAAKADLRYRRPPDGDVAGGTWGCARPNVFINDPGCVNKTYAGFWADLASIYEAAQGDPPLTPGKSHDGADRAILGG